MVKILKLFQTKRRTIQKIYVCRQNYSPMVNQQWTLSALTSKHKMAADSLGIFVYRVLGEMAVRYVNVYMLQKGAR